jgi:NADPH2:quinone reductase
MRIIRHYEHGGPEVLRLEEADVPDPADGQVLIRSQTIGVNFNAAQRRWGRGPLPSTLPGAPSGDVVGIVEAVGAEVTTVKTGDRVAATVHASAYADFALADARWLIPLPTSLDPGQASVLGAPGQVALSVLKAGAVAEGETVLVHAAAGTIGHLAVQLAKILGAATVVATAGSPSKLEFARAHGADIAVDYTQPGWGDEVREATGGGVDLILDSVGGDVFAQGPGLLAPFGRLVFFGTASGSAAKISPMAISDLKSVSGSSFAAWRAHRPQEVRRGLEDLIDYVAAGRLQVSVYANLPLPEAEQAHRLIEDRSRTGRVLLTP